MAKCDLSIELDDAQSIHPGGGTIHGVVRVHVDADVNCNGLEVTSVWRTHGRGNVASGKTGSATLFSGQWRAGENLEYRFELPVAQWPPSYHGHYLNIDHYVDARAKIPWGFDPKASVPFQMRPTCGPEGATSAPGATEVKGLVGCVLASVFAVVFIGVFFGVLAAAGPFALFMMIIPLIIFLVWLFRVFLPKYLLGEVQYRFGEQPISPGGSAQGELAICPRKNVAVNGISILFRAREQCVSGSGSNRTTHKHVFFESLDTLQAATTLMAGQEQRFNLSVTLPEDAPYSIDLSDNDLIWSATLRVDIPRWPDWVKEIPLTVAPSGDSAVANAATIESMQQTAGQLVSDSGRSETTDDGITFQETAGHVWAVREQQGQVEMLAEAVSGLTFELEVVIERRLLYAGDEDPHVYEDGYAVWGHYTDPPLPLVLYVPHELADEFEQAGRDVWRGRGTVVGWDHRHGRLQVKVETVP